MDNLVRNIRPLAVLLVVFMNTARAWDLVDKGTLDRALGSPPALIALIQDPNDPKTMSLEAEWDELSDKEDVPRYAYKCRTEDEFCDTVTSTGLLSLVMYTEKDNSHMYHGPRSASDINLFVRRMQRPVISKIPSSRHDSFIGIDDAVCLCIASPEQHKGFISAFEATAKKYRSEYTFGITSLEHENVISVPTIKCRKYKDSQVKVYQQNPSGIEAFMLEALRPIIADLTPYNHQTLLDRQWPMIYIFGHSAFERAKLRRELSDFASSWPDLTTVIADPLDFPDLPTKLGLENEQSQLTSPAGAVHQLTTGKIWPFPAGKALDKKSLQQWGMDVWQGKIQPWNAKGKEGGRRGGQTGKNTVKTNRQIRLPNVPGLEKLRERLEGKGEL